MAETDTPSLTTLTVDLLSAYLSNNSLGSEDIAALVKSTHAALSEIGNPAAAAAPAQEYTPAVSVRKSLGSRDQIISLIDGKPYKTLKRHLASHGLTPAEYRTRYNLPATYPMVAPAYSDHRRNVANTFGLGRRIRKNDDAAPAKASAKKPAASGITKSSPAKAATAKPAVAKAASSKPAVTTAAKPTVAKAAAPKPSITKAKSSAPATAKPKAAAPKADTGKSPAKAKTAAPKAKTSAAPASAKSSAPAKAPAPAKSPAAKSPNAKTSAKAATAKAPATAG